MEIAYTVLLLAAVLVALLVVRLRWSRIPRSARTRSLAVLVLLALPLAGNGITGYETTSELLNTLLLWDRLLLYSAGLFLFTLLRPRWLTAAVAVILILPLFSASSLGRLSALFGTGPIHVQHVDAFLLETIPWSSGAGENSGVDFAVASQPSWLHGLRRGLRGGRLYNSQCQTDAATLLVDPVHHQLHLHCPPLASSRDPSGTDLVFPMP